MLLGILLAVLMVVCVALIAVILLQRSEGGAFGMTSGGPGAFMTARGTGDFLTRTTEILVAVFFGLCLLMTIISSRERNAAALIEKMKGLPTISAAQPVSAAPAVNQAPAAPGAPATGNLGTPSTGAPLNLLGNTPPARPAAPVTMPAPAFQPPLGQPTLSSRTAKTQPHKGAPASATSSPPAPIVAPPPVVLPPPPAAPANQ